jgi:tRNA U54 and U55 pseudouridine synthase Pus10
MTRTNNIRIVSNSLGFRSIILDGKHKVCAGLAALASGKDKWVGDILMECVTCKEQHPVRNMELHGQYCHNCWEAMDDADDMVNEANERQSEVAYEMRGLMGDK